MFTERERGVFAALSSSLIAVGFRVLQNLDRSFLKAVN